MTRASFVAKYWPLASEIGQQYNLAPVAILAHALKEAGAGNVRAERRHNYFGFLKGGQHVVYPDDRTGFTAYARRMNTTFSEAAAVSGDAAQFAKAVAYASKPVYVDGGAAIRQKYQRDLISIYHSVARDVARLGLQTPMLAGLTSTPQQTALVGLALSLAGGVIGAAMTPKNRYKGIFYGGLASTAVMLLGQTSGTLAGLGALELSDNANTPLKRRPIEIIRTDRVVTTINPDLRLINQAARPLIADRILG